MMRIRLAAIAFTAAALIAPSLADANGRLPDGTSVRVDGDKILFPSTFGLLTSDDDGASFQWVCEVNIGYGGTYDPDYAVSANGDIWATTFEGLRVSRDDGCTWETVNGSEPFYSDVEIGPDGRIWAATASGGAPNDVYVSSDGVNFVGSNLLDPIIWWRSVRVAPSDADTLYVTGFKLAQADGNGGMLPPEAHLRKSIDGGATWAELPVTDFTFGSSPNLFVVAVAPADPNIVFARVLGARDPTGDDIYRSIDGGATWTLALSFQDFVNAFTILSDGLTVIAGTRGNCIGDEPDNMKGCVQRSEDLGATWALATQQPKMGCIHEGQNGEVLACGANWEPDNFALGRSTDKGQTWSKIVRFSELAGPLSCPVESPQFECSALDWPSLCVQLGICDTVDAGGSANDAGEGEDDGGKGGGCFGCSSGTSGLALIVVLPILWRRRKRE